MTSPDFAHRPPNVSTAWWYNPRTPWHARQQAVYAWIRDNRPVDNALEPEPQRLASFTLDTEALIESAMMLLEDGVDPFAIAERLGTTVTALEQRFRRRGIKELARPFLKARKNQNMHPCADCGKPVSERAKRCHACAMQEMYSRPEIRAQRSDNARRSPFGEASVAS